MDILEIYDYLCTYDSRNSCYFATDPDDYCPPRENCSCDNCFYGRDKLAMEIIRLRERSLSND